MKDEIAALRELLAKRESTAVGSDQRAKASVMLHAEAVNFVRTHLDTIERLQAERDKAVEALRPFKFIADTEERAESNASVMVNINRCRHARATLQSIEAGQ